MKISLPLPILLWRAVTQPFWSITAIVVTTGIAILEKIEEYLPNEQSAHFRPLEEARYRNTGHSDYQKPFLCDKCHLPLSKCECRWYPVDYK